MPEIASKFYPITDIYFKEKKEVSVIPGEGIVQDKEPSIIALHIFNWSPTSYITVETASNQIITFPPTSLVEGAVYYMHIKKLINAGPNSKETQVMAVSTSQYPD